MKTTFVATALVIAMALSALGQTTDTPPVKVPDSATAIRLAEKALTKVYGKKVIESERPFNASLSDGVWHVTGTLYCNDTKGNVVKNACVGGVAMADIRQSDGRVLRTGHTM
jgi:NTF2 fold immunity protein